VWFWQTVEVAAVKAKPAVSAAVSPQAAALPQHKVQRGWARPVGAAAHAEQQPPPPPAANPSSPALQGTLSQTRQGATWTNGPEAGSSHRASLRALAAEKSHAANMLKAQVCLHNTLRSRSPPSPLRPDMEESVPSVTAKSRFLFATRLAHLRRC
jgi:hypothetical protein